MNLKTRSLKWELAALRAVRGLAAGLIAVGVCCAVGYAANDESETSPRELIYAYKVWKLTDMLDLSEDQMPAFFARIKGMEEKEFEISQGEREAAREIGRMLERREVGDQELAQALRHYEEVRDRRGEELRAMRREALEMLSVRQRCNYVVFEERFRDEMRQLIRRARDIRRGEAPDGLGGGRRSGNRPGQTGQGRGGGRAGR